MWEFGDTSSHVCGKDVVVWDSCDMRCGSQDAECRPARCLTLKTKSGTRRMRFSSRLWTVPGSCLRTSCQSLLIYKSGPKSVSVSVWRTVCLLVVDVQVCTVIVVVLGIRVRSCWSVGAVCTVEAIISLVETFSQREQTVELIALLRRPIRVQVSVAPCRLAGRAAERCELQSVVGVFTVQSFSLWGVCEATEGRRCHIQCLCCCFLFVLFFDSIILFCTTSISTYDFLLMMTMFLCRRCNQSVEAQLLSY